MIPKWTVSRSQTEFKVLNPFILIRFITSKDYYSTQLTKTGNRTTQYWPKYCNQTWPISRSAIWNSTRVLTLRKTARNWKTSLSIKQNRRQELELEEMSRLRPKRNLKGASPSSEKVKYTHNSTATYSAPKWQIEKIWVIVPINLKVTTKTSSVTWTSRCSQTHPQSIRIWLSIQTTCRSRISRSIVLSPQVFCRSLG